MRVRTVIDRELRVQARARVTYWIRVLAGGAGAAALAGFMLAEKGVSLGGGFGGFNGRGPWLFALLHSTISIVLAVACPLMAADTISRERREGTLGLLLLTPLQPRTVVLGKVMAHLLRAFALWLAMVPVLGVPILMGGLGPVDFGFALALELGVVLGGLAAGLLASSFAERWESAMGLAVLFAVVIGEILAILSFLGFLPFFLVHDRHRGIGIFVVLATLMPWVVGSGLIENGFSGMLARLGWETKGILAGLAVTVPASALIFVLAIRVAARRIKRLGAIALGSMQREARLRFWLGPRGVKRSMFSSRVTMVTRRIIRWQFAWTMT